MNVVVYLFLKSEHFSQLFQQLKKIRGALWKNSVLRLDSNCRFCGMCVCVCVCMCVSFVEKLKS